MKTFGYAIILLPATFFPPMLSKSLMTALGRRRRSGMCGISIR
jgi:hypothetical protein